MGKEAEVFTSAVFASIRQLRLLDSILNISGAVAAVSLRELLSGSLPLPTLLRSCKLTTTYYIRVRSVTELRSNCEKSRTLWDVLCVRKIFGTQIEPPLRLANVLPKYEHDDSCPGTCSKLGADGCYKVCRVMLSFKPTCLFHATFSVNSDNYSVSLTKCPSCVLPTPSSIATTSMTLASPVFATRPSISLSMGTSML